MDRPSRTVVEALSCGEVLYCTGWSDAEGYSLPYVSRYQHQHLAALRDSANAEMAMALTRLWALIATPAGQGLCDQQTRASLITIWLYAFRDKVPECIIPHKQAAVNLVNSMLQQECTPSPNTNAESRDDDSLDDPNAYFFKSRLPEARLAVSDPSQAGAFVFALLQIY